jgi:UDP-3-O-[3-hydroxymyristoyl] glucosamine N-acyltransferase
MVGVGVVVGNRVMVGDEVWVGDEVCVGDNVIVGDGVIVGRYFCPGLHPKRSIPRINVIMNLLIYFIVLLHRERPIR